MKKVLIISKCCQCYNSKELNKEGKRVCSQINIELERVHLYKRIPKECTLMDTDILDFLK